MNDYISKIYNQLTNHTFNEALLTFEQLDIKDGHTGDLFFETFGVPNTIELFNAPFERFVCYEFLMQKLKEADANKFSLIHKGTPYYFLAWTAFEIRNYGKSVFYMDLALGEDIRKILPAGKTQEDMAKEALGNPGGNLWKFVLDGPAIRIIQQLREYVSKALTDFQTRTSEEIKLDDFVNKFVIESITKNVKNRSLISALYSYICETQDMCETLKIRSQNTSSIEPLLDNLFKGGLIFESLLKMVADLKSWNVSSGNGINKPPRTLEAFGRCNDFLTTFNIYASDFKTSVSDLNSILSIATDNSLKTSFSICAQLRNTAGHDLRRDDIFQRPHDYRMLTEKQINAILFVIKRVFL